MIKIILYGMRIHPGNFLYIFMVGACFLNEGAPWWLGLCTLVFWIPLYIYTSYLVGRANWDSEHDCPEE